MHSGAFVLICLCCLDRPCCAQSSNTESAHSRRSLTNLLLAINPSGPLSAVAAKHRVGQRTPVTSMIAEKLQKPQSDEKGFFSDEEQRLLTERTEKNIAEAGFTIARIVAAVMMYHHGIEKLLSVDLFTKFTVDKYFSFLPGDHAFYTYCVGVVQLITPILFGLGIFSRVSGLALATTMLGALFYSKVAIGLEGFPFFELKGLSQTLKYPVPTFHNYGFETPALYMGIFLLVAAAGPGKFSVAGLLGWNDDKSFKGKLKQ